TEQGATQILLWGAIGIGFKKLIVVDVSRLTRESYRSSILQPSVGALKAATRCGGEFMQDNARPHRGGMEYLRSRGVRCLAEQWPASSCDLNCIETLWSHLQYEVSRRGPYGKAELIDFTKKCWDDIPQQKIDTLCAGFLNRCEKCVASRGECIKPPSRSALS
ncbi:MAG: hypothetical protein Q8O19_03910, partial [Rectinemataceae bacterium]|nr:hypothetical protein [Rectinemataceae bacterium]